MKKTHLTIEREILAKILAEAGGGARGLMDIGVYAALLDLAAHQVTNTARFKSKLLADAVGISRITLARSLERLATAGAILAAPEGPDETVVAFLPAK